MPARARLLSDSGHNHTRATHLRDGVDRAQVQLQMTFCCDSSLKIDVRTEQPFLTGWQPNRSQATCGVARAVGAAGGAEARAGA